MIHLHWVHLPVIRVVAGVTFIGSRDVVCGLANRGVIVVAAHAGSQRLVVIHTQQGYPGNSPVAGLAAICSRYMVCRLGGGYHPVMAGDTTIDYVTMIKYGGYPGGCAVTIIACITAG